MMIINYRKLKKTDSKNTKGQNYENQNNKENEVKKMKSISISNHARQRASQRGISFEQIELCISYGERINRTGMEFYCMTKKCLKKLKKATGAYMDRLQDIIVMTNYKDNGALAVVTVYKNQNGFQTVKKKQKRRRI